jgi:hypothetical protein
VRRAHWVTIGRFRDHGRWARVEARIASPSRVEVTTANVATLRLDLPAAHIAGDEPVELSLDGTALTLPPRPVRRARRVDLRRAEGGVWELDSHDADDEAESAANDGGGEAPESGGDDEAHGEPRPAALAKRPGLSGPVEDIYFDPIVVVYGTRGEQTGLLRQVARHLARPSFSSSGRRTDLRYPVVPDRRYSPRRYPDRSVVLVGTEADNAVLARIGPEMPVRMLAGGARVGRRRFAGEDVGATFIYPNPENPDRYVRVVGGTSRDAYRLLHHIPLYLPDYAVYDKSIEGKRRRRRPVVGEERNLLAAGTFDEHWRLPAGAGSGPAPASTRTPDAGPAAPSHPDAGQGK